MRFGFAALCIVALTALAGCENAGNFARPHAFPVKGRLYAGNGVAANAHIAFHPVDAEKSQGRCAVAITAQDGSFELTTYRPNDGAPAGDYTVTIFWPDDNMPDDQCECPDPLIHDRFGGKYAKPQETSLAATVLPQANEVNLCAIPEMRIMANRKFRK